MMKHSCLLLFISLFTTLAMSQEPMFKTKPDSILTKVGLFGRVMEKIDKKSDSLSSLQFASVAVYQKGVIVAGVTSDLDGWFFVPLEVNEIYDIRISYIGFKDLSFPSIKIDGLVELQATMEEQSFYCPGTDMGPCLFYDFFVDGFSSGQTLNARFIRNSAIR